MVSFTPFVHTAIQVYKRSKENHMSNDKPGVGGKVFHLKLSSDYWSGTPMVVIPCGIPTSGKSTWIDKVIPTYTSISRDTIRYGMFGKDYKQNVEDEKLITHYFDVRVSVAIKNRRNIVLDNTHCKKSYLDAAIKRFEGTGYKIVVVFFDIPLWKAYLRNYKRKLQTGKWIPKHVIQQMYTNYKKINKDDYAAYKW